MSRDEALEAESIACRYCQQTEGQAKAGLNRSGTRRYWCNACRRHYTPMPRAHGYPESIRRQAAEMHAAGVPLRRIGKLLGVNHQSVVNWTRSQAEEAASAPPPPQETVPAPSADSPPLMRRATIADVARRAGVAASTVSNLLNDKGRMSEETRRRIRAAMDELHFSPNALVRAIRARRTRILGVLIFDLNRMDERVDHALTIPLLAGIYRAADAAGQDVLLYTGWPERPARHSGLDFLNGHVDGLLWAVPPIDAPALARVATAGLPVMAMLSRHVPDGVGYVNGDNVGAVRDLVRHLVAAGHCRIAFAGPARNSSNFEDRRAGYRQGLTEAGLPLDTALEAHSPDTRLLPDTCVRIVNDWLALPSPPTAVVAVTDEWAEAVGTAYRARGIRIPEDVALTGFDDVPAAVSISGGLTTVRQPFAEIGSRAVERLLALINGAPVESCRITLPAPLVVRASTNVKISTVHHTVELYGELSGSISPSHPE